MGYKEQLREASQDQTGHVQEGSAGRMGSGGTVASPWDMCCQVSDTAREFGPLSSQDSGELRLPCQAWQEDTLQERALCF